MSSDRSGGLRQPLRTAMATTKKTASPLTPRLAPNNTAAVPSQTRATSPKRLTIKTPHPVDHASPLTGRPTPPIRSRTTDTTNPHSLSNRRPAPSSTNSTPTLRIRGTPSSRSGSPMISGTPTGNGPRLALFDRSPKASSESTPAARHRAAMGAMAEMATPSPLGRSPGLVPLDTRPSAQSAMFFHADEAKLQDTKTRPHPPKATSSFLYADGRQDDDISTVQDKSSPVLSSLSRPSPVLSNSSAIPSLHHGSTLGSPSAVSSLSAPVINQAPFQRPTHPKPQAAHESLDRHDVGTCRIAIPSQTAVGDCLPVKAKQSTQPSPSPIPGHLKSSAAPAFHSESPGALRRRSLTWNEANDSATAHKAADSSTAFAVASSPQLPPTQQVLSNPTSPVMALASPSLEKSPNSLDLASEARRERKVLDLEISNSSLLAINRSLEREIKRQKTELKRFRRLSRAGRFSIADDLPVEDGDDQGGRTSLGTSVLPPIGDSVGRPSSPFDEHAVDKLSEPASDTDSDAESEIESEEDDDNDDDDYDDHEEDENGHEPSAAPRLTHAGPRQQNRRAKDEARLRRDLRKHRELLLDTAKTNRSLQRCLTWTEDLIRHGRRALGGDGGNSNRGAGSGSDDDLGSDDVLPHATGRDGIRGTDVVGEYETSSPEDLLPTPSETAAIASSAVIESLMDIGTSWSVGRSEAGNAVTERDSGVDFVKGVLHHV